MYNLPVAVHLKSSNSLPSIGIDDIAHVMNTLSSMVSATWTTAATFWASTSAQPPSRGMNLYADAPP